jgi:hypothetical protein
VNLKSHAVESFQDHHIRCYFEGGEHFKPLSFKWYASPSYDKVVIKTEHISVHLHYDARVHIQEPAEQMSWTSDSQSHCVIGLMLCMKWS